MKISVISDLHIGENSRGKDMCPGDHPKFLDKTYKKDFIDFIRSKKITSDYLIVSGDISDNAKYSQFKLATDIITEIASELKVIKKKIIYVPGNHDTDWDETSLNSDSIDDQKYRISQRYQTFINGFTIDNKTKIYSKYPYYAVWDFDDLLIIGYNSAWNDSTPKIKHYGFIESKILEDIEKNNLSRLQSHKTKIFVLHHHPYLYSNLIHDDVDLSAIANADSLLDMLTKYHFDMIIHGHRHIPSIKTLSNSVNTLSLLCAGSFSVILDQKWSGQVLNMFHRINIDGRDNDTKNLIGHVENYNYLSNHKWIRSSKEISGLYHKHAFGYYGNFYLLKNSLIQKVSNALINSDLVKWSELCSSDHNLKYLTREYIDQLISEITKDLDIRHNSNEEEILLYK